MSAHSHCMPLSLTPGAVLRIDRGRRVGLRAATGLVWLTEGGSPRDLVLEPGDSTELIGSGRALVAATRPARIIIEIPSDVSETPRLELAESEGAPGRVLPVPSTSGVPGWLHGLLASLRALVAPRGVTSAAHAVAPEGALAVKLRAQRRAEDWHLAAGGANPFASNHRDYPHPYF